MSEGKSLGNVNMPEEGGQLRLSCLLPPSFRFPAHHRPNEFVTKLTHWCKEDTDRKARTPKNMTKLS